MRFIRCSRSLYYREYRVCTSTGVVNRTWISGSVGATLINTSLLASKIPVLKPWLQMTGFEFCSLQRILHINQLNSTDLENWPRIAGIEPRYNPWSPICGSFEMSSGNESVDAWTRVWYSKKDKELNLGILVSRLNCYLKLIHEVTDNALANHMLIDLWWAIIVMCFIESLVWTKTV